MKFKVNSKDLKDRLNIIKSAKSLAKPDDILHSMVKINTENDKVSFLVNDGWGWSCSVLDKLVLGDSNDFCVEEEGTIFVDGHVFIGVCLSYPDDSVITLELDKNKSKKGSVLKVSSKIKKKSKKTNSIVVQKPTNFIDEPVKENRESIVVSTPKLKAPISIVEFASSRDPSKRQFWGVFTEIFDKEDIAAVATNKEKICWYDEKGLDRNTPAKHSFCCNKEYYLSAIKSLNENDDTNVEIGRKFTILRQKNQWHIVQNITKEEGDEDFDWRTICSNVESSLETEIKIPKDILNSCISTAKFVSQKTFGIVCDFDTENNKVIFNFESIETGGRQISGQDEIELEDDNFNKKVKTKIILSVDSMTDIIKRFKSEEVIFKIKDNDVPIIIKSNNDNFTYITGTIDVSCED